MSQMTILPDPTQLELVHLSASATNITAVVKTRACSVPCPVCGEAATRVHSRYVRMVADMPWHGVAFRLRLRVRRFFCERAACPRAIFAERLPTVVAPYGRRTARLAEALELVGSVVGGEAGRRVLVALGLGETSVSPDTLLRAVRRAALAATATPRILSVDDFAFRRGRSYGTILVDLERHRPLDLLPDRSAETFARWLRDHPGVEVIARDRGGAYAEGGRKGAPQALQVADRFHLLKNLFESLDRLLLRQQRLLSQVATQVATETAAAPQAPARERSPQLASLAAPPSAPSSAPSSATPTYGAPRHERLRVARQERRRARYEAVTEAARMGMPVQAIARRVGLARNTVRRYLRAEGFPEQAVRPPRWRKMAPFEGYLRERWDAGEQNAAALLRAIQAQGYTGSASTLREHLGAWRDAPCRPGRRPFACMGQPAPPPTRSFSLRHTRWLLLGADPDDAVAQAYTAVLVERSPTIRQAQRLVTAFAHFVQDHDASGLDTWLAHAQRSGIAELVSFADGVQRDYAAVAAALRMPWSQGQTEGQVNRLKVIKRQMYGRARFDLLRQRVLLRATT